MSERLLPPLPEPTRKRRPHWRWLILIAILAFILIWGYVPMSTGPASGGQLTGSAIRSTTRPTIKIATFNIHSGRNSAGDFNLDRTAKSLKGFDLIALNEVRGSMTAGQDQATLLGQKLNMQSLFAPTEYQWWHESFGNGLLTALPVKEWKRTPLAGTMGRGKRNLITAQIILQGKPITILITHIDRGADRQNQLKLVIDQFSKTGGPVILMGDLNTSATDQELQRVRLNNAIADFGPVSPADNIDWIFVLGLDWIAGGIQQSDASDHPIAWAELGLTKTPSTTPSHK